MIIADRRDKMVEATVQDVTKRFGGHFDVQGGVPWRQAIRDWKKAGDRVVHLTAYGLPLPKMITEIQESANDLMVIIGSEKMPGKVFKLADWNVSVTNQPMSEVAALAIFLDWYKQHDEFDRAFPGAEVRIIPSQDRRRIEPVGGQVLRIVQPS